MVIDRRKIFAFGLLFILLFRVAAQHETSRDTVKLQVIQEDTLLDAEDVVGLDKSPVSLRDTGQVNLYLRNIDATLVNKFRSDPAFDYDKRLPSRNLWEEFIRWMGSKLRKWFPKIDDVQLQNFFRIVFIVAAVILIVLIVWMILRGSLTGVLGKKSDGGNVVIPSEENIKELDLDALIAVHIGEGNYRFAIRYMFLKVLKILDNNKKIKWKPDKTNYEFGREIKDADIRTVFFGLTYIYDVVWYGNFPVNKEQFENLKSQYDAFYRDERNISK
ncbi:MAG: hypothetical protein FWG22_03120 [Prolixibacteraceae bacterium]|nr:hypothetical protein [Prolixibacteraceae bacterium]